MATDQAGICRDQGKQAEADELQRLAKSKRDEAILQIRQSLQIGEQLDGKKSAQGLHNLAAILMDQGKFAEAEPVFLESIELKKKLLGAEDPDVAATRSTLAQMLHWQGRTKEALQIMLDVIRVESSVYGQDHPKVQNSWSGVQKLVPKFINERQTWVAEFNGRARSAAQQENAMRRLLAQNERERRALSGTPDGHGVFVPVGRAFAPTSKASLAASLAEKGAKYAEDLARHEKYRTEFVRRRNAYLGELRWAYDVFKIPEKKRKFR